MERPRRETTQFALVEVGDDGEGHLGRPRRTVTRVNNTLEH